MDGGFPWPYRTSPCNTRGPSAVDLMTMIEDSLAPSPTSPLNDAEQSRLVADIDAALPRVHRYAPATPLLRIPSLDSMIGGQVLLKAECAQATGSFKIRGALNVMTQLSSKGVDRVIAFSSGNHGIGVAYAARCLGMSAQIVVPDDAPAAKIDRIRRLGGELIWYDRMSEDREQVAKALQSERPAPLVKPYDSWDTIAGQGTCGAEVVRQVQTPIDAALICTGGGGLAAGVGAYLKSHCLIRASSPRSLRVGTTITSRFSVESGWKRLAMARSGATAFWRPPPGNSLSLLIKPIGPKVFT